MGIFRLRTRITNGLPQGCPNVIIKELYVDHFLENDDLTLADLSDQLNVIRVPSKIETDLLHAFIPSMLYGDADRRPAS